MSAASSGTGGPSLNTDKILEVASDLAGKAKDRATQLADEQKATGADRLHGISDVIDRAADTIGEASPQAADLVRNAARSVEDVSRSLREKSVGSLISDVSAFARREPAAFFGASVVAGFALARFLKSSNQHAAPSHDNGESGSSSRHAYEPSSYAPAAHDPFSGSGDDYPAVESAADSPRAFGTEPDIPMMPLPSETDEEVISDDNTAGDPFATRRPE